MILCSTVEKTVIRNHYDIATLFYRCFWGPHIHHGYWYHNESSTKAQEQLTARLAERAEMREGSRVYDIGCGMGGSSRWLAEKKQCRVTGITLSPIQRGWCSIANSIRRTRGSLNFLCADAETIELPSASADYLWSIECTEHLFDKPAFFRRASKWLKPGGRFALCAWLAGEDPLSAVQQQQAMSVCRGMFCPSLGNRDDYRAWLESAGMTVVVDEIWTHQVKRTWEICLQRTERVGIRRLAKLLGKNHVLFLDHFQAILDAYNSGAMEYGAFIAEKRHHAH